MTEDAMVGWHHRLDGHGFGWTPGMGDGQGGLACCGPWGCKESDRTWRLNNNNSSSNNILPSYNVSNNKIVIYPIVNLVVRGVNFSYSNNLEGLNPHLLL